ncbi:MAG: thioredoxin [Candidatus Micrarchaeota archaeon]|nr:thioredoxin [Candidatus Micrarchaeota archaeon]MDE1847441.1 thioredoxin [Candidatus Micrarchaeota archaeon]MDE1864064.1 thioredoxin [Candidatus Micrarchaeota archaeon]
MRVARSDKRLYIYSPQNQLKGVYLAISDITKDNFEKDVIGAKEPVVVDFWAEWCGPCRVFSPIVEEVSADFKDKVKFYKLNVDNNPEIAERYNVMSIPTAMLFEKGEVKAISIGALPKESLKKWLTTNL